MGELDINHRIAVAHVSGHDCQGIVIKVASERRRLDDALWRVGYADRSKVRRRRVNRSAVALLNSYNINK